jgi:nitrite reductase/ring-hydroxylating ferredoxin subunit
MAELNLVCNETDVLAGEARIVKVRGLSIGLFRTGDGSIRALLNVCPHRGAPLCEGPQCGTTETVDDFRFNYVRAGDIVRCAWHGWEFDIASGRSLVDPEVKARTFPVEVKDGKVYVRA